MGQQATTDRFEPQLLNGWLGSLVLHGLLLVGVLPLFHLSPLTAAKEPFHWDVALVRSAHIAEEPSQHANAIQPLISKPREHTPMPSRAVRTDRFAPIEPQTAEPVTPVSQSSIAPSPASPNEVPPTSISEKPTPIQPQTSDSLLQQAEGQINSMPTVPSLLQTAAPTTNAPNTAPSEVAQPSSLRAQGANTDAASTARLDYGWLQQAIFQRLEELKRSSRPSLDDSRPLKVTVRAVVSREGVLLDSMVVQSSGQEHIDQEAMVLVQRAFPMPLTRPLNREQIAMRIPITYSRD